MDLGEDPQQQAIAAAAAAETPVFTSISHSGSSVVAAGASCQTSTWL
jgi:hypothetical protein